MNVQTGSFDGLGGVRKDVLWKGYVVCLCVSEWWWDGSGRAVIAHVRECVGGCAFAFCVCVWT